jgi:hypothetical protein
MKCQLFNGVVGLASLLLTASVADAQAIGGRVTDSSGGVLPGVTVEVRSPALIEQSRSAVTDGAGQYLIVELVPGSYTVSFAIAGFSTIQREAINLTTGFTATVNAELSVGDIAETLIVSGQSPVVDVQNTRRVVVLSREVVDIVPSAKTPTMIGILIPGMLLGVPTGNQAAQDVGGQTGNNRAGLAIHGGRHNDQQVQINGILTGTMQSASARANQPLTDAYQEFVFDVSGHSAEVETGGVYVNMIPQEGGNRFTSRSYANFADENLQSGNITDALRQRGLTDPNRLKRMWAANSTIGGPIMKDRVWFFGSAIAQSINTFVGDTYVNPNPAAWQFQPDRSQQAVSPDWSRSASVRTTWQATPRNKVGLFYQYLRSCLCTNSVGGAARRSPEASVVGNYFDHFTQLTLVSPVTNRLLFEAAGMYISSWQTRYPQPESVAAAISDLGTGVNYRASSTTALYASITQPTRSIRGSLSYVTGSHALKTGFTVFSGDITTNTFGGTGGPDSASLGFNEVYQLIYGVPDSVIYYGNPTTTNHYIRPNLGLYVQDQWTVGRITANAGLRLDYWRTGFPDQTIPPTQYVPITRTVNGQVAVAWTDLSPRLGVAYDPTGKGKTAIKASLSRYVVQQNASLAGPLNLISNNNSDTRQWTDNGDFVVQGDPFNPAANLELGRSTNLLFGRPLGNTTFDPEWARGFGKRPYNWETSVGVQHELAPQVSASVAYFHRAFGNFSATENRAASPADYSEYCVDVPSDPRLPTSGQRLCGLYDVNANKLGKTDNLVTAASNFGTQSQRWDGLDLTTTVRLSTTILQGGISSGKTTADNCDITTRFPNVALEGVTGSDFLFPSGLNSNLYLQSQGLPTALSASTAFCHVTTPMYTQAKLLGAFTLPWAVQLSATYQNVPGGALRANAVFSNAQIAPSLGRPLSAGSTRTINVLTPATRHLDRMSQLDLRVSRLVKVGGMRIRGMIDFYNALNSNVDLVANATYGTDGSAWRIPIVTLPPRLAKVGVQIDF